MESCLWAAQKKVSDRVVKWEIDAVTGACGEHDPQEIYLIGGA